VLKVSLKSCVFNLFYSFFDVNQLLLRIVRAI
jgi:hypothetical protein